MRKAAACAVGKSVERSGGMVGLLERGRHERVFVAIAMMALISVMSACQVANVPARTPRTPIDPTGIMSRIPAENPLTSYNAQPTELLISETPSPSIASPSLPGSTTSPSRMLTATFVDLLWWVLGYVLTGGRSRVS